MIKKEKILIKQTMKQCEFCWSFFNTRESVKEHQKTSKSCQKYKHIVFNCVNCGFSTRGVKNIHKHISSNCASVEEKIEDEKQASEQIKYKNNITLVDEQDNINFRNGRIETEDKIRCTPLSHEDIEVSMQKCDGLFDMLKNRRAYTKILGELRKNRLCLFGRITLDDYNDLVLKHVTRVKNILVNKGYADKKITTIVSKGLSVLETRFLSFGKYTSLHLEVDDIQTFYKALVLSTSHSKKFTPYNAQSLSRNFYNYSVVLFPVQKLIELFMVNVYGFWNIIYLKLPKSLKSDPYSFYVLERVNNNTRHWVMDCRLEELSNVFAANVVPFMVNMFRKIYRDVFNDNDFRPDYMSKSQITECDCEQLLQNIFTLSHPLKSIDIMRDVVKTRAAYKPTVNDKFNLYGDDNLQRKRMQGKFKVDCDCITSQLFDNKDDAIVTFYKNKFY